MKKEYLIYKLSDDVKNSCKIDTELFSKYGVKRGLRNDDGSGVLVGLTNIGNVVGYNRAEDGKLTPCPGKLYYRGYELDDLVAPLLKEKRFGFEPEITAKVARAKLKLIEVPISYYPRTKEEGKKIKLKDGFRALYCIMKYKHKG